MTISIPSPLQLYKIPLFEEAGIEFWVKRDDLIHPTVSGNKWRKLKFNLEKAKELGYSKILTFGGAFSNHIASVGAIAKGSNLKIHAMVRGDELNSNSNPTLREADSNGLNLHFVSRADYKLWKKLEKGESISEKWKDHYIIPEGGANEEGVRGCESIMQEISIDFSHICLSAGTGTTAAGILRSNASSKILVFPALKNAFSLEEDILSRQVDPNFKKEQLELITQYHFGGFAKVPEDLINFTSVIKEEYGLPLDYLYTAKAFYGLMDLVKRGEVKAGSKVLFYHSGGLQGNSFIDQKY